MRDRDVVAAGGGGDASETELGRGLRRRLAAQRLEQLRAPIAIARFEELLGEHHARRQIAGLNAQRLLEARGAVSVPGEPPQDDGIEVEPVERGGRERLGARVRLVRGIPLFPRVERPRERTDGGDVSWPGCGVAVRARDRLARGRRKRVGCERRKGRKRRLREKRTRGADRQCGFRIAECGFIVDSNPQ